MTTDLMEAYSLEEGDQILVNENIYRITDIALSEEDDDYLLYVVDEEGYRRGPIKSSPLKKFRLVLDNLALSE